MPSQRAATDGALLRGALSALNQRLRHEDGRLAIGPTGLGLLSLLFRHSPISASELADKAYAQPQSLTRPLQALEKARLIRRREDPDDHRRAILTIAPKGEELLRATAQRRSAWLNHALSTTLNDEERETMRRATALLSRLAGEEARERASIDILNVVPFTHVHDVARSIEFYEHLGFVAEARESDGAEVVWASLRGRKVRQARIMLARSHQALDAKKQGIEFYCWTDDVAKMHERATAARLSPSAISHPPYMPDGEFVVTDPDGYRVMIGEIRRTRG